MKRNIHAGLIAFATWSLAFVLIAAAATVCSSCGGATASAASSANCAPAR
jgi:hypothetical protein